MNQAGVGNEGIVKLDAGFFLKLRQDVVVDAFDFSVFHIRQGADLG